MIATPAAYKKSSFGPAFLFLSKEKKAALAVYYAFCRLMDDIADEPDITDKQQQLDFWKEEINRVFQGTAETELGRQIQHVSRDFAMTPDRFYWLIEGMEADVQGRIYQNSEELEWYLWRVAGIVGLATLDILGIKGPKAQDLAQSLGFAVQLTNIVRDVQEDAELGRVYLPESLLKQYQLTRKEVLIHHSRTRLSLVLAEMARQAELCYARAGQIMQGLPHRKILPCLVMSSVYRANLAKIEKTDFKFEKAIKLSKFEKIKYAVYALFKMDNFK